MSTKTVKPTVVFPVVSIDSSRHVIVTGNATAGNAPIIAQCWVRIIGISDAIDNWYPVMNSAPSWNSGTGQTTFTLSTAYTGGAQSGAGITCQRAWAVSDANGIVEAAAVTTGDTCIIPSNSCAVIASPLTDVVFDVFGSVKDNSVDIFGNSQIIVENGGHIFFNDDDDITAFVWSKPGSTILFSGSTRIAGTMIVEGLVTYRGLGDATNISNGNIVVQSGGSLVVTSDVGGDPGYDILLGSLTIENGGTASIGAGVHTSLTTTEMGPATAIITLESNSHFTFAGTVGAIITACKDAVVSGVTPSVTLATTERRTVHLGQSILTATDIAAIQSGLATSGGGSSQIGA